MAKHVQPSATATAFNCVHCGTLTTQTWSMLYADRYDGPRKHPPMPNQENVDGVINNKELAKDPERHARSINYVTRVAAGELFYNKIEGNVYPDFHVPNLNISQCYQCHELSVWLHDALIHPGNRYGIEPNEDLNDDIRQDFNEAREIINNSPRGAAALLRLCVQKLCMQLGEEGNSIDQDIGSLVGKGLNPLVQEALDVVRVIGNEAVHPGSLDLRDDRDSALQLLILINTIADQMITHPKNVKALYAKLPATKRAGIDARNERALKRAENGNSED